MKYILGLSLSGICLAMFVFVIQGNAISADVDFGSLLNGQTESGVKAADIETLPAAEKAGSKTATIEPATKGPVTVTKERPMSRNEAIRKAVKGRSWEEAKPDVIKVLNDYGGKKAEVRQDEVPVKSRPNMEREDKAEATGGITEEEAVTIALKNTHGEMIGVKWKKGNYRVKVWSEADGATYKIYIDPQSGKVVRRKRK